MKILTVPKLVINLPERVDRLVEFEKQLTKLFAEPTVGIVEGVRGNIVAAHKRAVKFAADRNWPEVLIMEDDVKFINSPKLVEYAEAAFNEAPNDFKILAGGVYGGKVKAVSKYWNEVTNFAGAHFLVYKSEVYNDILNFDFGTKQYDRALSLICKVGVLNKFIAIQNNGYSDHRKKIVNDDHYLNGFELLN